MAAFCGRCGKPLAADARFCGGCGAPASPGAAQSPPAQPPQAPGNPPYAAPVKSGSSALKILLVVVLLGGAVALVAAGGAFYFGRKKLAEWRQEHGAAAMGQPDFSALAAARHDAAAADARALLLSQEEVGAIIGVPVTSIEMSGRSDATYKTATQGLEAGIEVERKGESDAIMSMNGARQVTERAFGGKGDKVAGLGDDAVYGAFNVLYVRKGGLFLTIMPPNLQQAAQLEQYSNMAAQPLGSAGQRQAMEKLQATMKGDPLAASLAKPDAASGAVDLIQHAAAERGNVYETKARLMARQMAEKVLAKNGS